MRKPHRYFKDSWLSDRYSTAKGEKPPKFADPGDVMVLRDGKSVGSFRHDYSWWPEKFLALEFEGQDYAIYAPTYSSIGVMKLPECEHVFTVPIEWWSEDDCPLAFYGHPYLPGLIVVIWIVWGLENDDLISYLWLSPDGSIKTKPRGPWNTMSWLSGDPAGKFFEINDLVHLPQYKGEGFEWEGQLLIKTEIRQPIGELVAEREKFVGPMPTERIYEDESTEPHDG